MSETTTYCAMLVNDIHVSKNNISDFTANWKEAIEICREKGIENMIVGGDLFQSRSSQTLDVLLAVSDALKKAADYGILITLANGNHDKVNPEAIRGYCHIFDTHPNVFVVDDAVVIYDNDWDFALHVMAYFPENGTFVERLQGLAKDGMVLDRNNYLYVHEGINGGLSRNSDTEVPASIFKDFDKVFVGHYHNRSVIEGTKIEYIGSSRQHNFGEDTAKGYTLLRKDGTYEFVENRANVRYRNIEISAESIDAGFLNMVKRLKSEDNCRVKLNVIGTGEQIKNVDRQKLLDTGAYKIELISEDTVTMTGTGESGLSEKYTTATIRENYILFCEESRITDTSLGLTYLSNIS